MSTRLHTYTESRITQTGICSGSKIFEPMADTGYDDGHRVYDTKEIEEFLELNEENWKAKEIDRTEYKYTKKALKALLRKAKKSDWGYVRVHLF